jgi:23S rRNA pseudouridine2605 synthase
MSKRKKSSTRDQKTGTVAGKQRLQRVMASAGVGSRRECEVIIEEGRVEVDGQVVVELGVKVDLDEQEVFVDGERLVPERLQYFMLNKPPGIVSTSRDPSGRTRVIDLIKTDRRVYNVGRLDQSSEGLILVTNDGELANRLTHPRYGVEKVYHVQVAGIPSPANLRQLEKGVYLAEGKAQATRVRFLRKVKNSSWIEIVLAEGRNREIRRMLATIGHKVRTLKRVAIGPLRMRDLPVGAHRQLTASELRALKRVATGAPAPRRKKPTKSEAGRAEKKRKTATRSGGKKSAATRKPAKKKGPRTKPKIGSKSHRPAGKPSSKKRSTKKPKRR